MHIAAMRPSLPRLQRPWSARVVTGCGPSLPARQWSEAATMGLTVAPLVIACGALATELRAVLKAQGLADTVEVTYLPANLHNRPERIVPELEPLLDQAREQGR